MDISQLSQLPLTVLVIIGAYWVIQRINDEHSKKLVELIGQFSKEYMAIIDRNAEEREEARQRWMERDKLLIATLIEHQKASQDNAAQTHNLRTTLAPLVLWWEAERHNLTSHNTKRTRPSEGNKSDSA